MQNKNIIRFVGSLVLLPITSISLPFGNLPQDNTDIVKTSEIVFSQKLNTEANGLFSINKEADQEAQILKLKAEAIDTYFKEHDMPLIGTGIKMAEEAEKNGLDWRLVAAIAVRESTGGKFACKRVENNPFGWGSCRIGFDSLDKAIEIVAKNLGGNNPNTAHHYSDKTTKEILQKYNPPSIVPKYADQVMSIMNDIGPEEITLETSVVKV